MIDNQISYSGKVSEMLNVSLSEPKAERIKIIKDSLLDHVPGICTERLKIYTEVYDDCASYAPVLKRQKRLYVILMR